ncbi:MAG: GNAT family N-acetyltransferase [Bacteroidetes bacterium]|nr:GNAT family N-acetyltransferase [Bacteroidota bacterium]
MYLLHTTRLHMRELTEADAPFMYRMMNSEGWLQFIGDRHIRTHDDAAAYLRNVYIPHYATHSFGFYVVSLIDNDEPLGLCGLIKRDGLEDVDIGFAFLPEYQGKGYALEAAKEVMNFAATKGISNVVAITTPDNEKSVALLRKIGFTQQTAIVMNDESLLLHTK